jgi:RHS repeat-associated protein
MAFNVVRITDGAGQVVAAREYDAFGNILSETGDWTICDLGFQSNWIQMKDSGGTLYLTPSGRVYDTRIGRFLQKDPAGSFLNPYDYALQNPLRNVDPAGRGVIDWILTGKWDPTRDELEAATRGWVQGFGQVPWDPRKSLGQWLYTGKLEATEKELEAALSSQEMAHYINCYSDCLACEATQFGNLAGAAFTSYVLHAGVPKPIADFLAGTAGGPAALKSAFRVLSIRFQQVGVGGAAKMLHNHATAFKSAVKGGKWASAAARVAAVAAAILAIYVAQKCMRGCIKDPCYKCDEEKATAPPRHSGGGGGGGGW